MDINFKWRSGMGTTLTLIFLVLKLTNLINWSWWLVWLPMIIEFGLVIIGFAIKEIMLHRWIAKMERRNANDETS